MRRPGKRPKVTGSAHYWPWPTPLCPGDREHRERFEKRARSVGLNAWAPVGSGLGRALPVDEQDAIAEQLRAQMESVPR